MFVNAAAQSALSALSAMNQQIERSTEIISTGRRINGPQDSSTYWKVAAKAESDLGVYAEIAQGLKAGAGFFKQVDAALGKIHDAVRGIRDVLIEALDPAADRTVLQDLVLGYRDDINAAFADAELPNGRNVLTYDSTNAAQAAPLTYVSGLTSTGATSTISVGVTGFLMLDTGATTGDLNPNLVVAGGNQTLMVDFDVSTAAFTNAEISAVSAQLTTMMDNILTARTVAGTAVARMENSIDFLETISATKQQSIADLVNADLEKEAATLSALQAQQALSVEALAIANTQVASILALFR